MTTYQEVGQAQAYILLNRLGTAQAFIVGPFYTDPDKIPPEAIIDISSTYTVTGFDTTQFPISSQKEASIEVTFVGTAFGAKFETTGSNYDTVMWVRYTNWNRFVEDDDSGEGYTSLIDNFYVTTEETYIIGIYSYWAGQGGSLNFQITPYLADHILRFGTAQAKIKTFDVQKYGQARAYIKNPVFAQALSYIQLSNISAKGQSRARMTCGVGIFRSEGWTKGVDLA